VHWNLRVEFILEQSDRDLAESDSVKLESVRGTSESQGSERKRTEICWTNYPPQAEDIADIRGNPANIVWQGRGIWASLTIEALIELPRKAESVTPVDTPAYIAFLWLMLL